MIHPHNNPHRNSSRHQNAFEIATMLFTDNIYQRHKTLLVMPQRFSERKVYKTSNGNDVKPSCRRSPKSRARRRRKTSTRCSPAWTWIKSFVGRCLQSCGVRAARQPMAGHGSSARVRLCVVFTLSCRLPEIRYIFVFRVWGTVLHATSSGLLELSPLKHAEGGKRVAATASLTCKGCVGQRWALIAMR